MTNGEKYKKDILRSANLCKFLKEKVLKPNGIQECDENISCHQCRLLAAIWSQEEYQEPETDWSKVPVDTPVLVRDHDMDKWKKRYFAKYEYGKVYTYSWGKTSWSNEDETLSTWNLAKLVEDEER